MKKKIVTHSGRFHADDVFAVAILLLIFPRAEIIRTRDAELIAEADIAVDVGNVYDPKKLRFDHHQGEGAGKRENGIPYASFGLVWKEYGAQVANSREIADLLEKKMVMYIDAIDNGVNLSESLFEDVRAYTISDYLYSYWLDEKVNEEEIDKIFLKVVDLAKDLVLREIDKAKRIMEDMALVENIYQKTEDKSLIILDNHLAWGKILTEKPEPMIVVYPSIDGESWHAKAVRIDIDSFETRVKFPNTWAGKVGLELAELSGVPDALFCHRALFLTTAHSKNGAVALARKALNE